MIMGKDGCVSRYFCIQIPLLWFLAFLTWSNKLIKTDDKQRQLKLYVDIKHVKTEVLCRAGGFGKTRYFSINALQNGLVFMLCSETVY